MVGGCQSVAFQCHCLSLTRSRLQNDTATLSVHTGTCCLIPGMLPCQFSLPSGTAFLTRGEPKPPTLRGHNLRNGSSSVYVWAPGPDGWCQVSMFDAVRLVSTPASATPSPDKLTSSSYRRVVPSPQSSDAELDQRVKWNGVMALPAVKKSLNDRQDIRVTQSAIRDTTESTTPC